MIGILYCITIYGMYLVTVSANAHKKVVWFDISVYKILIVYILNSANHLKKIIIRPHSTRAW